jgi:hypothetical protein
MSFHIDWAFPFLVITWESFAFIPINSLLLSSHNIYLHPTNPPLNLSTMSKVTMHGSSFGHYNTDPNVSVGPGYSGVSYSFVSLFERF